MKRKSSTSDDLELTDNQYGRLS